MAEFLAVLQGLGNAMRTISNIADGKQNGVHGLTQLASNFGSLAGSFGRS